MQMNLKYDSVTSPAINANRVYRFAINESDLLRCMDTIETKERPIRLTFR